MIGIDEVGRGCWAGPLLVCGVELSKSIDGLGDSKKISKSNRLKLEKQIKIESEQVAFAWVSPAFIDRYGLSESMRAACKKIISEFSNQNQSIVIDGNVNFVGLRNSRSVIKAEDKFAEVAAASVLAKVARDRYMNAASKVWQEFSFENNVGYGTAEHRLALKKFGITNLHRKSYKPVKEYIK